MTPLFLTLFSALGIICLFHGILYLNAIGIAKKYFETKETVLIFLLLFAFVCTLFSLNSLIYLPLLPPVLATVLIFGAGRTWIMLKKQPLTDTISVKADKNNPMRIIDTIAWTAVIIYVWYALTPISRPDSWNYHFLVAKMIATSRQALVDVNGHLIISDHLLFTGIFEYIFVGLRQFTENDALVHCVSQGLLPILLIVTLCSLNRFFWSLKHGLPCLIVALVFSVPETQDLASGKPGVFLIPCALVLLTLMSSNMPRRLFWFGCFLVVPCAFKLTWVPFAFSCMLGGGTFFTLRAFRTGTSKAFAHAAKACIKPFLKGILVGFIPLAPFLVKNYVIFNNPVHPFQNGVFKTIIEPRRPVASTTVDRSSKPPSYLDPKNCNADTPMPNTDANKRLGSKIKYFWSLYAGGARTISTYFMHVRQLPNALWDLFFYFIIGCVLSIGISWKKKSDAAEVNLLRFIFFYAILLWPLFFPAHPHGRMLFPFFALPLFLMLQRLQETKRTLIMQLILLIPLIANGRLEMRIPALAKSLPLPALDFMGSKTGRGAKYIETASAINQHIKSNCPSCQPYQRSVAADQPPGYFVNARLLFVPVESLSYNEYWARLQFEQQGGGVCLARFLACNDVSYFRSTAFAFSEWPDAYRALFQYTEKIHGNVRFIDWTYFDDFSEICNDSPQESLLL